MFSLSRRQGHAVLAGAAASATYLAAAEIGSKRPVKVGGLFLLSSMAMAGMVGQVLNSKASAKAHVTEARLNHFLGSGGSLGGNLVVNGNHTVTGSSTTDGNHTIQGQLFGSAGTLDVGDHLNMQGNNVNSINTLTGTAGTITAGDAVHVTDVLTADGSITSHNRILGDHTTGDAAQGNAPASYSQSSLQGCINRVNDILAALG